MVRQIGVHEAGRQLCKTETRLLIWESGNWRHRNKPVYLIWTWFQEHIQAGGAPRNAYHKLFEPLESFCGFTVSSSIGTRLVGIRTNKRNEINRICFLGLPDPDVTVSKKLIREAIMHCTKAHRELLRADNVSFFAIREDFPKINWNFARNNGIVFKKNGSHITVKQCHCFH